MKSKKIVRNDTIIVQNREEFLKQIKALIQKAENMQRPMSMGKRMIRHLQNRTEGPF